MRRSGEEFKLIAYYIVGFVLILAPIVGAFFLTLQLSDWGVVTSRWFDTVVVVLWVLSSALSGYLIFRLIKWRNRRRDEAWKRIDAWLTEAGFEQQDPEGLPRREDEFAAKDYGYRADARGIDLAPFSLEDHVRVVVAYTRRVKGVEVAVVRVQIPRHFSSKTGQPSSFARYTVVMAAGMKDLPLAWIEPQGRDDRALLAMGATDLDVESAAFNDQWRVYTMDARKTHGVFTPTAIAHLVDSSEGKHSVALSGSNIVTARGGWLHSAEDIEHMVGLVRGLVETVPQGFRGGPLVSAEVAAVESIPWTERSKQSFTSQGSGGDSQKSRVLDRLHHAFMLAGLAMIATPFFFEVPRGETRHWALQAMIYGGIVLAIASSRLARFIVGDRRAVRRPRR